MADDRVLTVVASSIKVMMPKELSSTRKPKPALFVNGSRVVCHLTHGFDKTQVPDTAWGSINAGSLDRAINDQAWRARAEFDVDSDDPSLLAHYEFGFVQIVREGSMLLQYAGEKPTLGSISVQPSFQDSYFLDSKPGLTPWTEDGTNRKSISGRHVVCTTGDHPAFMGTRKTQNFHPDFLESASIQNHFQLIRHNMFFVTVLTQLDKRTNRPTPLASFRWRLQYRFDVRYQGGSAVPANLSVIDFDPQAKVGPPDFDGDEKKIYEGLTGELFNTTAPRKYDAALEKGSAFRKDSAVWFLNIPKNFFA